MKYILTFCSFCVVVALVSNPAIAQESCDKRTRVINLLEQKYQEMPVAMGVTSKGGLIEVLSTKDGKTWTIILSTPGGTSCLVASGEGWKVIEYDDMKLAPRT